MGHADRSRIYDAVSLDAQPRSIRISFAGRCYYDSNANSNSNTHIDSDADRHCHRNANPQTDSDAKACSYSKAAANTASSGITGD